MPWFGVKTFVRTVPTGRPRKRDSHFQPGLAHIEEIVQLFEAKTAGAAIAKARAGTRKYCRRVPKTNVYGQKLVMEWLDCTEVFEMYQLPSDGAMVGGGCEIVRASEPLSRIMKRRKGRQPRGGDMFMFHHAAVAKELSEEGFLPKSGG